MMQTMTQFLAHILNSSEGLSVGQGLVAILICYFGGFLSSLTPCVYPMIPITLGVVGGMGPSKKSWKETCTAGAIYLSGMTVVYAFLGVLAGVSGRVFGSFTNSTGWYLGLGIVMSLSALMMLEVIPFDPLTWWELTKRKFQHSRKSTSVPHSSQVKKELTAVGTFFLGASSGLIAAPCTTPVLTSILAFIAKTQSVGLGFLLMFAFSMGLGTLLFIITAFAGAIQVLPRSGQWMKTIKSGSGLILLAFAEYLIYRAGGFGGK